MNAHAAIFLPNYTKQTGLPNEQIPHINASDEMKIEKNKNIHRCSEWVNRSSSSSCGSGV